MTASALTTDEIFNHLRPLRVSDFYKRKFSAEQRGWLNLLCERYIAGPPEERLRMTKLQERQMSFLFFSFAKIMAVEAVRENNEPKILLGLASLAVENFSVDWRDSLCVLILLYHSAQILPFGAAIPFKKVAAISTPQSGEMFLTFLTRTPKNLDLAKFYVKGGTTTTANSTTSLCKQVKTHN